MTPANDNTPDPAIGDDDIDIDIDVVPMSFAQRRLWFLDRLEPASTAFLIPLRVALEGTLDLEALRAALADLLARHETLRTAFAVLDGEPVQLVAPSLSLDLPLIDLSPLAEAEAQASLADHAARERALPFDLSRAPLMRGAVLRLGPESHVLSLTLHHIIADGWSLGVLVREMGACYAARRAGRAPDLPPLEIQYGDFAAWQTEQLSGPRLDALLTHWTRALAGAPPLLTLPTDRPRPPIHRTDGALHAFALEAPLVASVEALARAHKATPLMVFAAAFGLLLGRLAGQDDVVVGTPIAGRTHSAIEGLIGLFINTLPLRVRLNAAPTFAALVEQLRETALAAYAHQDLPFERLVEALRPDRGLDHSPVFQAMLTLQNLPDGSLDLPGLRLSDLPEDGATAKYDLTLTLAPGPQGGMTASLEYATALFDAETIARWAGHFLALLRAAIAAPDSPATRLPLLSPDDRRAEAQRGQGPLLPPTAPVHHRIAAQAATDPDRPAVENPDGALWSLGRLWARAEAVAQALTEAGLPPGGRVGVCLDRSPDLIAALLGVWAAGGVYVPLDPIYPPERLALMLEDSEAPLLLTGGRAEQALPPTGPRRLRLEALPATPSQVRPPDSGLPDHPIAYVIYTSGSTGRPKGVVVPHAGLGNFLEGIAQRLDWRAGERVVALTTVSFDIATLEMFLPLLTGGVVILARAEEAADGERLAARLADSRATVMQATPSGWRLLVDSGWHGAPDLLALAGGEPLPGALASRLLPLCRRLWNLYGPTETSVYSAAEEVTPALAAEAGAGPVSLGPPLANTTLRILDPHGAPVPPGVAGELFIGGAGLALGYHGRPGLTAERFVPDPDGPPGARLYHTGDLVRRRADGRLWFLGRSDHQIKLRGYRIELGEVEAALRAAPGVAEAAARVIGTGAEARLVGYVVPSTSLATLRPDTPLLRKALGERLPDYMIPAQIVPLEALPLTPNGKLDRKALPDPAPPGGGDRGEARDVARGGPPRDALERSLAAIWRRILHVETLGRDDDFFALGGHSLLAVGLMTDIRREVGRGLPIATLFQAPTIAGLAAALREAGAIRQGLLARMARGPDSEPPVFLLPGAGGHPAALAALARLFEGHRTAYGVVLPGAEGEADPVGDMTALATMILPDLRRVQPNGPYHLIGHSFGAHLGLEIARQLLEQGEQVAGLVVLDTVAPLLDHLPRDVAQDEVAWMVEIAQVVSGMTGRPVDLDADRLRACPKAERLALLGARLAAAGWTPPGGDLDNLEAMTRVYRTALSTFYRPPAPVPVSVTLVMSAETRAGGPQAVADPGLAALLTEPDWGWSRATGRPVTLAEAPGGHASLVLDPHVQALAEILYTPRQKE